MPYKLLTLATIFIFVAGWAGVYFKGWIRGFDFESSSFIRRFFLAWMLLLLFNYFYLGPNSFIHLDDEGELVVPFHRIVASEPASSQYSHRLASGIDLRGAFVVGGEFFSPNRWLIASNPLWLGILAHKIIIYGVSFAGTYWLVQRGLGQGKFIAIALAALFSVSHFRLLHVTFDNGMSWGLLPLAAFAVVFRAGGKNYFPGVAAFAVYAALFSSPNHVLFPLLATLFGAALIVRRNLGRIALGSSIVVAAILLNWAESIYAMLQLLPHSAHSAPDPGAAGRQDFSSVVGNFVLASLDNRIAVSLFMLALIVGMVRRTGLIAWAAALLAPLIGVSLFHLFPWEALGMGGIRRGAGSGYFAMAWVPLGIMVAAPAFQPVATAIGRYAGVAGRTIPPAIVIAIAAGTLGYLKAGELNEHFNTSGQAIFRNISNLGDKTKWPAEPFRIVSLADRMMSPRPNIPTAFYGLDQFDGWLNVVPSAHAAYWKFATAGGGELPTPAAGEVPWRGDGKISLPLLAVANVRFIVSPIPIEARGLRLMDGPESVPVPYQQVHFKTLDEKARFYGWFARKLVEPWAVYVYEIAGALPRAYAAGRVVIAGDEASDRDFHALVGEHGPGAGVVIRARDARRGGLTAGRAFVPRGDLDFQLAPDGFAADWKGAEAGIAVFNAVHTPFFRAFVDGAEAPVIAANGVQMAVPIPSGAKDIRLVYRRPSLIGRGQ